MKPNDPGFYWVFVEVKIQWIFGRSQVERGKNRVERGKIHSTGFYWVFVVGKNPGILGKRSLGFTS